MLNILSSHLPQEYAVALALGNVNPKEKDIVTNRYPAPSQVLYINI
jgi:hypothetical protein